MNLEIKLKAILAEVDRLNIFLKKMRRKMYEKRKQNLQEKQNEYNIFFAPHT